MKENSKRKKARALLSRSGYKTGGHVKHSDEAEDKSLIKKEVKPSALKKKLADGGCADGGNPKPRADRLKRGGRAKHHGKKPSHTQVNVIVGHGGQKAVPVPKPVPVPVPVGGPGGAGPMAGPPGGAPMPPPDQSGGMGGPGPMGLKKGGRAKRSMGGNDREKMPGMPMGHFKRGGKTYPIKDGAGGGEGRLEKKKAYGA